MHPGRVEDYQAVVEGIRNRASGRFGDGRRGPDPVKAGGSEPEFDVIVVGAGPGGSNAAAVALRGGLRVAQIDQQKFPRVKPCAGGVTAKALSALQLKLDSSVRHTATDFELNAWNGPRNRFSRSLPMIRMVYRPEFDNALVAQNMRSEGFTFFAAERVVEARYDKEFQVMTTRRTLSARQLVAADGAYSTLGRLFKVARPKAAAVAVETNVASADARLKEPLVTCLDFGAVERGYGWVFPKDDHWSVGLYTYSRGIKNLRHRLTQYMEAKGFALSADAELRFEAHLIPVGGYRLRVPRVPLYVVGDAGGFADALTGEGIYHALESGRLAGTTACMVERGEHSPSWYYRRLWKSVLVDTFLTYHGSRWFYRDPEKHIRLLENPLIWRPMIQGLAAGATLSKSTLRAGQFILESLRDAGVSHQHIQIERAGYGVWPGAASGSR
jgi:geranylgeranyl reductase family protein